MSVHEHWMYLGGGYGCHRNITRVLENEPDTYDNIVPWSFYEFHLNPQQDFHFISRRLGLILNFAF